MARHRCNPIRCCVLSFKAYGRRYRRILCGMSNGRRDGCDHVRSFFCSDLPCRQDLLSRRSAKQCCLPLLHLRSQGFSCRVSDLDFCFGRCARRGHGSAWKCDPVRFWMGRRGRTLGFVHRYIVRLGGDGAFRNKDYRSYERSFCRGAVLCDGLCGLSNRG